MNCKSIFFPGNVATVEDIPALRNLRSGSLDAKENRIVQGGAGFGDHEGGIYAWDPAQTAADNDKTYVKPNDRTPLQAGRWTLVAGAASDESSYFDGGMEGTSGSFVLPTMDKADTDDPATAKRKAGTMVWDADIKAPRWYEGTGASDRSGGYPVAPGIITQVGDGAIPEPLLDKARLIGISPRDFGAKGDGANRDVDESGMVQLAIDACYKFVPPAPLRVDGYFRVKKPLKFNRPVDSTLDILRVYGVGVGAGFLMDGAFTLIDSDIAWDNITPVSGEICFQNLNFVGTTNTVDAYVISPKFINVWFELCEFIRPKLLLSGTYSQGITLRDCVAKSWRGDWWSSRGAYDCHVDRLRTKFGGVPVDGAPLGHIFNWTRGATQQPLLRNSITNGAFEGCGKIGKFDNMVQLTFAYNYCEYNNGMALDLTGGGNVGFINQGNTFIALNEQVANAAFYEIALGSTLRPVSIGNYCNSRLYNTTGITGDNFLSTTGDVVIVEFFTGFKNNPLAADAAPVGNVDVTDAAYGLMQFRGGVWQSSLSGLRLPSGASVPGTARSSTVVINGSRIPIRRVQGTTNPQSDSTPYGGPSAAFGAGSYVENMNLASGQPRGWRCTTGGVGGSYAWVADAAYP